jgi:hypothetical protein
MALVVRRRGIVRRGAFGQDEDARARAYMDESDADVTRQHAHVIPRGGTGAPAERVRSLCIMTHLLPEKAMFRDEGSDVIDQKVIRDRAN